jgi:hypothetical protein
VSGASFGGHHLFFLRHMLTHLNPLLRSREAFEGSCASREEAGANCQEVRAERNVPHSATASLGPRSLPQASTGATKREPQTSCRSIPRDRD